MMTLVLDTSTDFLLMAIMDDSHLLSFHFEKLERQHAEQLLPTLENLLHQAKASITDITSILVSHGPGSFTGVRLAITFVKTLALTQPLTVYAIPSLAFLAKPNQSIFATMDARANRHYVAAFQGFHYVLNPTIMTQEEQQEWLKSHPSFLHQQLDSPKIKISDVLASVIQWKSHQKPLKDVHVLTPLYLKDLQ